MSEVLGRMERPSVREFEGSRKLYFVPLIFSPQEPPEGLLEKINRYWEQVEAQVANLEQKVGSVGKVYHELVPAAGEDGVRIIEELNKKSYEIVKARVERGAQLQPLENEDLLTEFMDWSKCLAAGLQNQKVLARVYEAYTEAQKRRNEYLAKQINETLKDGEAALLLMREGHQVQFPSDIQVFYVAPPGLDEIKRWLREREEERGSDGS